MTLLNADYHLLYCAAGVCTVLESSFVVSVAFDLQYLT